MSQFQKQLLASAAGFGIGGFLWGWQATEAITSKDNFINPFSYILGAVFLGIFGSGSLVMFSKDKKKILKTIGLGTLGWTVAFLAPAAWAYQLFIAGAVTLAVPLSILEKIKIPYETLINFSTLLDLRPNFSIGNFWIEFLLTGIIIGIIYSYILHKKVINNLLYNGIGFVSAAIISPIVGNLIGNLFHFTSLNYLITFSLIGIILGIFLAWGIYKNAASSN